MMMPNKTKIICTLGPATSSIEKIVEIVNAGMNIARINFSHSTYDTHLQIIKNIRQAEEITGIEQMLQFDGIHFNLFGAERVIRFLWNFDYFWSDIGRLAGNS